MGGKSAAADTLADALTSIERDKEANKPEEGQARPKPAQVRIHRINPKSVTIGKLYGDFEKISRDWQDGILANTVREAAGDKSNDTHWITLDGPVDAKWIENLNTVLDDNMKLCLISGEIVKLTQRMKMMFEVADLLEASPATVSRCGMVYVSPEKLGWEPLLRSWIAALPRTLKEHNCGSMYSDLIMAFVPDVMDFLFGKEQTVEEDQRLEGLKPVVPVSKNWQFNSFLNLFESLLLDGETKESLLEKEEEAREREAQLQKRQQLTSMKTMKTEGSATVKSDDEVFSDGALDGEGDREASAPRKKATREVPYYEVMEPKKLNWIIQQFVMALIWGFGAPLTIPARTKYSLFINTMIKKIFSRFALRKRIDQSQFPAFNANLFSMFYNAQDRCWYKWDYQIDKYNIKGDKETGDPAEQMNQTKNSDSLIEDNDPADGKDGMAGDGAEEFADRVEFHNIVIATEETIKTTFLLDTLINHSYNTLLVGDTGTGKTVAIKKLSQTLITKGAWEGGEMVLSATTTPMQIQSYMESRLEKHKKGVFGPVNPSNRLLIFVDDLNMPERERYGAQPSLEMVRQILGQKAFYSDKTLELMNIVKTFFLCAMGTPGGGKTLPSMRLLRHFNLIFSPNQSKENLARIFTKILDWGFAEHSQTWQKQGITITQITIETYIKATQTLLPLPRRSHYLFNLRQVSEVIQGLFSCPPEAVEKQTDQLGALKRLWLHEVMRVFSDRLISEEDKDLFVQECLHFENNKFFKREDLEDPASIIFANFVDMSAYPLEYKEVTDAEQARTTLEKVVQDYNSSSKTGPDKLNILLFEYMIQHLARVSRILSKPFGNGLLVGLGGNGRKTVAKLASFINQCNTFEIAIHKNYGQLEWTDDLRNLYKTLGIDNKKTVFQFADKDIKEESFIEDINNILNVGELTSLFNAEDEEEINYEIEK